MNPTLHQLTALAERAQPEPGRFKVAWEVYSGDDLLAKRRELMDAWATYCATPPA